MDLESLQNGEGLLANEDGLAGAAAAALGEAAQALGQAVLHDKLLGPRRILVQRAQHLHSLSQSIAPLAARADQMSDSHRHRKHHIHMILDNLGDLHKITLPEELYHGWNPTQFQKIV